MNKLICCHNYYAKGHQVSYRILILGIQLNLFQVIIVLRCPVKNLAPLFMTMIT